MLHDKIWETFQKNQSVSTDSRRVKPGDIYFALRGEVFDGNEFAAQALGAGASLAVIDNTDFQVAGDDRYFLCEDSLAALQELGNKFRQTFSIPVIGITGTNGKTTTKELLHAVLSSEKKVHSTQGNLNNHIGVPLTLLSMPRNTEIAVVEMGANKHGDIAELAAIAMPTHGIITNIGRAHLELFADIEGVQVTKGELFSFIRKHGGTIFLNENDPRVVAVGRGIGNTITYGTRRSMYFLESVGEKGSLQHLVVALPSSQNRLEIDLHMVGEHNAENALVAVVVGLEMGIAPENIRKALAGFVPKMNRTQLIESGNRRILLDAYNANPSSMEAVIRSIARQNLDSVALVLGDMFELGDAAPQFHRELLAFARETFPEARLICVGPYMAAAADEKDQNIWAFKSFREAESVIGRLLDGCTFVLIKGSRGMALERLLPALGVSA